MSEDRKILMAVGRSGGHIYPAVAIAESLKKRAPNSEIHFIHSGSEVGKKIFSHLEYSVHAWPIGGWASGQNLLIKIQTFFQLPFLFFKSYLFIRKHKFSYVLGTGGAITGPVLLAALLQGCKVSIWEGNSTSGLANKYLSYFVPTVFTVFPKVQGLLNKNQIRCSYPLRESVIKEARKEQEKSTRFNLLVLGGSQGSLLLNQVLIEAVKEDKWREDLFIYHQSGEQNYSRIKDIYKDKNSVEVFGFTPDIYKYYRQADVIISRAGSGTIFEVAAFKKALVLIPISSSAGGHQLKNALNLQAESKVEIIKEADWNLESFKQIVSALKENKQKRQELSRALFEYCDLNGADQIAQQFINQNQDVL